MQQDEAGFEPVTFYRPCRHPEQFGDFVFRQAAEEAIFDDLAKAFVDGIQPFERRIDRKNFVELELKRAVAVVECRAIQVPTALCRLMAAVKRTQRV